MIATSAIVLSADSVTALKSIVVDQARAVQVGVALTPPIFIVTISPFSEHVPSIVYEVSLVALIFASGPVIVTSGTIASTNTDGKLVVGIVKTASFPLTS